MEKKLNDENIKNYFIDITYRIVPNTLNKYKLLTITGYDNTKYISYICCLALIKYEDTISFTKIFRYLNEMFNFNPLIVPIDYANSLRKALLTQGLFKKEPIINCTLFFSFCAVYS